MAPMAQFPYHQGRDMFTTNEALTAALQAVFAFAQDLDRGDILKHADIERVSGFPKDTVQWGALIVKLRRIMQDMRGIALRPIKNVGYKLCTKEEQLKWCPRNRQRRAIRQVNKGVKELSVLRPEELSLHQQRLRALTIQNMVEERRALKRGVREQRYCMRETEALPQRAMATTG
jgi:hypothetical protein